MWVTNDVFLWVNGILIAILLACGIPLIVLFYKIHTELSPLCQIAKRIEINALDHWLDERGLDTSKSSNTKRAKKPHHSLSPEKTAERDYLTARGKSVGLTQPEAIRLKALLEEDARNDFNNGLMGLLAFAALLVIVGVIVESLQRNR